MELHGPAVTQCTVLFPAFVASTDELYDRSSSVLALDPGHLTERELTTKAGNRHSSSPSTWTWYQSLHNGICDSIL